MAYATAQQLIDRIGEGAAIQLVDDDRNGHLGSSDLALIARYCEEASRIIDRVLSAQFTVPVTTNETLTDWCLALAAEQLYSARHGDVPPAVVKLADMVREDLQMAREGKLRVAGLTYPGDGFDRERRSLGRPVVKNPGERTRRLY